MKKSIKITWFLFSIFIAFASCSEDTIDDNEKGRISGTVVLEGSNNPVVNAKISTNPASSTVFTNESGDFLIEDVLVGDYSVQVQKDSLLTKFEGVTVLANSAVNVVFEMQPESVLNENPKAPRLQNPEDNSEGLNPTVNFVWTSSLTDIEDIQYTLELRNEASNEIQLFENIIDTTFTVENLNYDRKYFWQVKVSDGVTEPVWSEVFSFRTAQIPTARKLFTRNINDNNVIFSLSENGEEFQLTSSTTNSFRPRKNNLTNKIAFLRTAGAQTHLYTMDPDGSNVFKVTSSVAVNAFNMGYVDFSWANNGNTLVYPNFDKLYKINATGGGTTLIHQTTDGNFITECDVSDDNTKMAILTNNASGYNAKIQIIDNNGNIINTVIEGFEGAHGGLNLSVDGQTVLYTRDVSGFENSTYRQLDSRMFIYNFNSATSQDISFEKTPGTNDFDPRFSPDEAEVFFVNTNNDGVSQQDVYISSIININDNREIEVENAQMPDWE